jgi:hypothetical protein
MEITTQHSLSQAFIQQASVIIGHRQEIRGIQPLNQNDIQRECDNIKAVSPRIIQAGLDGEDGVYFFKYRLQGQAIQTHCEAADSPAVALYYGVKALKSDGISCKLSFPKPNIKDLRQPPYSLDQEISVRSELRGLLSSFEEQVEEALASTPHIEAQLDILQAILTDLESADWDDETTGSVLAQWAVSRAEKWAEERYQFKVQEIKALPDDERQRRSATPRNLPHNEVNDAPTRRITLAELALIEVYESRHLDIEAANRLACKHGYSSGQRLLKDYNAFDGKPNKRIGLDKPRPRNWMVKRLKYILPLLSTVARQKAEKELQTLMAHTDYKD